MRALILAFTLASAIGGAADAKPLQGPADGRIRQMLGVGFGRGGAERQRDGGCFLAYRVSARVDSHQLRRARLQDREAVRS